MLKPEQLPEVSLGLRLRHQHAARRSCSARQLLARQTGTKQIIMITDGEPTAHITPSGDVFFNYPPVRETVEATLREVVRCTRDGIRINTFMLDANELPDGVHRAADRRSTGAGRSSPRPRPSATTCSSTSSSTSASRRAAAAPA